MTTILASIGIATIVIAIPLYLIFTVLFAIYKKVIQQDLISEDETDKALRELFKIESK